MAAPARDRQAPLLKDLMDLPATVSTSSYVLKLSEAVTEEGSRKALEEYVVTGELLRNYRETLGMISTALDTQSSMAVYLHGSFGAGKSHFMAVLHALMSNSPAARARQEFDPLYQDFDWLRAGGKKFLLVPYHMLNADSLEHRVLGGYVDWVAERHPKADIPRVYRTDALFDQLRDMRQDFGDDQFLAQLNAGVEEEVDEWGNSAFWTPERLDAALNAAEVHDKSVRVDLDNPSTPAELRARLTQDAMRTVARRYARMAAQGEGFIPLDDGLAVIAEHAKSLGYDALVLFLDELMLWLTMMMQDEKRVLRESGKFTNFVEGSHSRRAIPVISFIARQKDLREITGEEMHGTAESAMQQNLKYASGRFDPIKLEDRNLPEIAHERLLKPRSPEARQEVQAGLDRLLAANPGAARDTWLGDDKALVGSGEEPLRKAYPFTPAFMDALVQISSALQRNRTGMKLMGEILADQRDRLRLGDLVSLGDLYPYLGKGGDKPFQDATRVVFESAERLYKTKLRPHLITTHKVAEEDAVAYARDPESVPAERRPALAAFTGDDRIMRTLLLSALAPGAVSLQHLTVERLLALNHGSIRSRFKGGEVGALEGKLSQWAGQFAEIKVTGSGAQASVLLELTDIDLDSILANANTYTQTRFQRDLAERILRRQLDLGAQRLGYDELTFVWKGSPRTLEVNFANVRDKEKVSDQNLKPATEGLWRIVVDYPFDDGPFSAREHANRIREIREQAGPDGPARTLAWLPSHLSQQAQDSFRRLTVIDNVLSDEDRFHGTFAKHLSQDKRVRAWQLLEAQRDTLTREAEKALKQAYGLADKKESEVQPGFDDHLDPVHAVPGLSLPIGAPFDKAVRLIAARLLERQFPGHPQLDPENFGKAVTTPEAKKVYGLVSQAAEARDRRVEVPAGDRGLMRRVAVPLLLGSMGEAYFELSSHWPQFFADQVRADDLPAGDDLTYVRLTDWLDRPEPRGLHETVKQLVIAAFAQIDDRVWVSGGAVQDKSLAFAARAGDALRTQPRPSEADWEEALARYESLFGDKPKARLYRGQIINQFATAVRDRARSFAEDAAGLVRRLEDCQGRLGLDETDPAGRFALARRSLELVTQLADSAEAGSAAARRTVETLAGFDLRGVSPLRYGTSLAQARKVAAALVAAEADWETLDLAEGLGPEGHSVLERLKGAARSDQQTADLAKALESARREVIALVRAQQAAPPPPQQPVGPSDPDDTSLKGDDAEPFVPSTHTGTGGVRRAGGGRIKVRTAAAEFAAEIRALAEADPDAEIDITWRVVGE
ncbi:BREX-2 system ATPase PglY [Streptomyces tsukubensis]|uniref:Phage resistance protein n=1 Tax=Streptomyces tsukubensis TaxID=83656 RepID=A0A1V4AEV2_9ACTN|nr:hypothetical protein [Streptomyces tsukubensis]OON82074.1 hypothetical protein B1H18_03170 [Streptomyces tsukubensis]QFR92559.1 phage resistance protein [Streptomyces tsukubensis]